MDIHKTREQLIKLEELIDYSFEIVQKSMTLWRKYKDTDRARSQKIRVGIDIHKMIIEAMRINPDMRSVKELSKQFDEVKTELDLAKRTTGDERRTSTTKYQEQNT